MAEAIIARAIAAGWLATFLLAAPAAATTLITAHEAQLRADNTEFRGAIERGPDVIAIDPAPRSGMVQSPFAFRVRFHAHGGTRIDLDSLKVIYMRVPAISLTARVMPFAQSDGIDMPSAEVPPGAHRIIVLIKDSAGHEGRADIHFDVEQQ